MIFYSLTFVTFFHTFSIFPDLVIGTCCCTCVWGCVARKRRSRPIVISANRSVSVTHRASVPPKGFVMKWTLFGPLRYILCRRFATRATAISISNNRIFEYTYLLIIINPFGRLGLKLLMVQKYCSITILNKVISGSNVISTAWQNVVISVF